MSRLPPRTYPEGVYLFDQEQTRLLEGNRARCLCLFAEQGYNMVLFPMVDYTESLVIGHDPLLTKDTCQLTDPFSGKAIGIRADITPQAVKLDAHLAYKNNTPDAVYRCCYADMTLQAKPIHWKQGRQILQVGAELFGIGSIEADIEIAQLMLILLQQLGVTSPTFDIGHIGFYKRVSHALDIDTATKERLFCLLQNKRIAELDALLRTLRLAAPYTNLIAHLPHATGTGVHALDEVRILIAAIPDSLLQADLSVIVDEVEYFLTTLQAHTKYMNYAATLHLDLCELRGYQYKTGLVFAVYHHDTNQPVALGGRYDNSMYGINRPATGFSANLHVITELQDG